jgi:hypothetical protein
LRSGLLGALPFSLGHQMVHELFDRPKLGGATSVAIQRAVLAFHADPAWQKIEKDSERNGISVLT